MARLDLDECLQRLREGAFEKIACRAVDALRVDGGALGDGLR